MQKFSPFRKMGYAILLFGFLVVAPCALQAQDEKKTVDQTVTRMAVIPFQAVMPEDESSTVQCPICGNVNSSGSIVKGSEKIVEEIFTDKLRDLRNVEIIPQERAAGVYRRVSADSLKKPLLQIMKNFGGELQADVLVVGFVYLYRERVGYDYSAERPASVAFEIHLISVKDGKTLWRGIYDKTQKSLMEDVFQVTSFFKGGAKWVTVRQLAKLGVDKVFATFPGVEK
jgi:hypothetical protein